MSWIPTVCGNRIDVLEPDPAAVSLIDISAGLARACRFNGQVAVEHYSVAEHCVVMSRQAPPDIALHCLLHDAAEAYLGDIVMPVKRRISGFDEIEARVLAAIYKALGIDEPTPAQCEAVHEHDIRMLATEKMLLVNDPTAWPVLAGVEPYDILLDCHDAATARRVWMQRFGELFCL